MTTYNGVVFPRPAHWLSTVTPSDRLLHRRSEPMTVDGDLAPDDLAHHFLAGRPCLDLVATIGERWRRAFERLRTPADLARWVVQAGMVERPPRVTRADLDAARRLRGAIARVTVAWGMGEPLDPDDVATINAAAAAPDLPPALATDGTPAPAATGSIRAVLSEVARDAVDLVTTGDPTRLRECAADDCSLLFHDASRPGARRWCSMSACGNRHKTAQYRRRHAGHR